MSRMARDEDGLRGAGLVCLFCQSPKHKHSLQGDGGGMWVQCVSCGARGPTVSLLGSLSDKDQRRRARERFYAPNEKCRATITAEDA